MDLLEQPQQGLEIGLRGRAPIDMACQIANLIERPRAGNEVAATQGFGSLGSDYALLKPGRSLGK